MVLSGDARERVRRNERLAQVPALSRNQYPFRGRDELLCHFTPERSSLNRLKCRAALSAELSDQAAVIASPHVGDG